MIKKSVNRATRELGTDGTVRSDDSYARFAKQGPSTRRLLPSWGLC